MNYTPRQFAQLRRMAALDAADPAYTDKILTDILDSWSGDLNAAAAVIWDEKAAKVSGSYDFAADGGDYKRSQLVDQYLIQASKFRARAAFGFIDEQEQDGQ